MFGWLEKVEIDDIRCPLMQAMCRRVANLPGANLKFTALCIWNRVTELEVDFPNAM